MSKLIFRYQTVVHSVKDSILVHECFADSKTGTIHALNPSPVTVNRDNQKAIESDSLKYVPVKIENLRREIKAWKDEYDSSFEETIKEYSEEEYDDDFYTDDGEVMDLVDYMNRNR